MADPSLDRRFLLSLHDVAPWHLARLQAAESLLGRFPVRQAAYLFVPDFHGRGSSSEDGAFVTWCRRERKYEVEWFLHGFWHREDPGNPKGGLGDRWRRLFLTSGEGEFLTLDRGEAERRIESGLRIFQAALPGVRPSGFIAPAWLFQPDLFEILAKYELDFTEDHSAIYRRGGEKIPSPVISWSTRNLAYRLGALCVCPLQYRLWRGRPRLRIALHPNDFKVPATVRSVEKVLDRAFRDRLNTGYGEIPGRPILPLPPPV